jgi:SAM-dependent methyltransferase
MAERRDAAQVDQRRLNTLRSLLGALQPGRAVDLGTGHGRFAMLAADLGYRVTAVDARRERWPEDERIEWVQADVREVDLAPFDLILCLGLFYHLQLDDQLRLLTGASGRPLVIDTHLDHGEHEHPLTATVQTVDGYVGRFYREPGKLTSSWGNRMSFWPTLQTFHRMLSEHGFTTVLTLEPWIAGDRTIFACLPDPP